MPDPLSPPLLRCLYVFEEAKRSAGEGTFLLTRANVYRSLWGMIFVHVLDETVVANGLLEVVRFQFLGSRPFGMTGYYYQSLEFVPYMSFEDMAQKQASVFLPNDILMRTFYEMSASGLVLASAAASRAPAVALRCTRPRMPTPMGHARKMNWNK